MPPLARDGIISGVMSSPGSAESYFSRGRAMAAEGHFEYAIDLFLDGLKLDPGNIAVHQELRVVSMRRKAAGGRDLGFIQKIALRKPASDAVIAMINAEKLMSYDPGNVAWVMAIAQAAHKAGLQATEMYFANLAMQANLSNPKGR